MNQPANQDSAATGPRYDFCGTGLAGKSAVVAVLNRGIRAAFMVCLLTVVGVGVAASDNRSAVLKVGATIPARPCQYPERCKPAPRRTVTSLSVRDGVIRYVGTAPRVEKKGDLVTITF